MLETSSNKVKVKKFGNLTERSRDTINSQDTYTMQDDMKIEGAQLPRDMSSIEKLSLHTESFDPDVIDKNKLMGTEALKAGFIGNNLPL